MLGDMVVMAVYMLTMGSSFGARVEAAWTLVGLLRIELECVGHVYIVIPCGVVELKKVVEEGLRRMIYLRTVALKMVKSSGAPDPCRYMHPVAELKYEKHETSICSFNNGMGWV